jgi:hypothetical protein
MALAAVLDYALDASGGVVMVIGRLFDGAVIDVRFGSRAGDTSGPSWEVQSRAAIVAS